MFSPLNVLVAYPYFTKDILQILKNRDHKDYRLMVDSGAFTAYKSGEPISLDDYCKFLDLLEPLRPFDAVQLDVIGDHEATYKNYEIMRSRGYDVLPVFTRGSDIKLLDHLFTLTDYLLIGGVAVGEGRQGYVKYLAPHIRNKKVHILGFTDLRFIKALRPYSVDSSGWNAGGRFGTLLFYQGYGEFKKLNREQFKALTFDQICRFARYSGLQPSQIELLNKELAWRGHHDHLTSGKGMVRWLGGYSYIAQAQEIEKNLNTRSYLALSTNMEVRLLFNAYDLYQSNNLNKQ